MFKKNCIPLVRNESRHWRFASLLSSLLLFLLLFEQFFAGGAIALAAPTQHTPQGNPNPALTVPQWLQPTQKTQPKNLGIYVQGKPNPRIVPLGHPLPAASTPDIVTLTSQAHHFTSRDGSLTIDIAAATLSQTQIQAAGGAVLLKITRTGTESGGASSGHLILGSYQLLFQDRTGKLLTNLALAHPLTIHYHLPTAQASLLWQNQTVNALWSDTTTATTTSPSSHQASAIIASTQKPHLFQAQKDATGLSWSVSSTFPHTPTTASKVTPGATAAPTFAAASSSITFSTQAPEASWGKPTDFQVGLNAGGLNYSYPLAIPSGPGGLTPPLTMSYSSGSVDEAHNAQGTAPWVGEGWNLNLGSISWSQENVTPGGANRMENVWNINDPSGISGQLIPPDLNAATSAPTSPSMSSLPSQYIWHTAPESHAKVQEINFNGQPCWHVWLPNGTMEEFGCTDEARQSAPDANGVMNPYRWDLDLMVDRSGNQIRIHYQRNWPGGQGIRDAVLSSIEYDDPGCHQTSFNGATAACSSWNPKVRVVFDASSQVANLTNSDCQGWSNTTLRCDDPADLSSSGGLAAPKATNAYVLNDVQVQVNGNLLNKYVFSYEQSHPMTITDPLSGQQESVHGYLDLTKIQEQGTNGTTLNAPVINVTYQDQTQHYEDLQRYASPSTNCGPSWTPRDGKGCHLWFQSYNARYISTLDNGEGWHENVSWTEAHANVHGVDSGALNDAFTCNSQQSTTNLCGQADDASWSRMVVSQRQGVTNGVTSTWNYKYYLRTNWPAPACSNCNQGYMWGNINDGDYSDYYNYTFTSFASTEETNPDGSYQIDNFASSDGIGIAASNITCYASVPCHPAPYSNPNQGIAGHTIQEQDYGTDGKLLSVHNTNYAMNCPPPGVSHSNNASGPPSNIGTTELSSELDQNNPVVVCDPRVTQADDYTVDGVTDMNGYQGDSRVLHKTTTTSYDGDNQGSSHANGYDYGNVSRVDTTANDVNGQHFVSGMTYYPNDNLGSNVYLTDLASYAFLQDGSGNRQTCSASQYGGNNAPNQAPSSDLVTSSLAYVNPGGCSGSTVATQHTYDASGVVLTGIDGDGHKGCTSGSNQYSACATYDSFDTHLLSGTNAKNQTTSYAYDSSAAGGFGQWETSTTDVNGQVTSYQYDALGRLTAVIRPGDSASSPTVSYTYTNTCANGSTNPCIEIDSTTKINASGGNTIVRQYYDGLGRLIESVKPGAAMLSRVPAIPSVIVTYSIYDVMGHETVKSMPYAIPNYSGTLGGNGYITPDQTQPRSVTRYDGAGRSLGTITYSNASFIALSTTISYTVAQGIPSFNVDGQTAFEQTINIDAYTHEQIGFSDALGRSRYTQAYSGTGSASNPYLVIRTVQYNQDTVGDVTSTITFDSASKQLASHSSTYNGLKQVTGWNDTDSGSCANATLSSGCLNSSDTAWKVSYDANGNQLSQTDPRGQTTYTSYDALDRPLCRGTSASAVNPCQDSDYALYFYDSYNNASNPGATFPSGCVAPSTSDPVGSRIAESFSGTAGNGWRCSGYDTRGQQTESMLSVTADGQTTNQQVGMTYTNGGQVASLTYPDGEVVNSTYDDNGLFRGLSESGGSIVSAVQYTVSGQMASMALGGLTYQGTPTTMIKYALSYDGIKRPLTTTTSIAGTTIFNQTRTYDNVGNVLQLNTTLPTTTGGSQTDFQSFCYDELDRLVWAGNTGTPTGGDHCGLAPSGTTTTAYTQPFSYDAADRITSGAAGNVTYDSTHMHAATTLSTIPNTYASYDAMGDMTCRNIDPTAAHTCTASSQTGATMTYDNEGRLTTWTAPSGTTASDQFLYDNEGSRVLQRTSTASGSSPPTVTDTITFDGYTETTINNGTTTTTKYYSVNGQRVAMVQGSTWYYLIPDLLGSTSLALNANGTVKAMQLYAPYGSVRYTDGSMPTTYNFTGQRLDDQTGLLYYNARYYDLVSGRFTSADTVQNDAQGMDPYAYVGDDPVGRTDPTGHCWPLCTMLLGAVIGAAVNVATTTVTSLVTKGHLPSGGEVLQAAAVGAVTGAITGALGPEAGPIARVAVGAVANGVGQAVGNAMSGKPLMDGVGEAVVSGAITGGLMEGAGGALKGASSKIGDFAGLKGAPFTEVATTVPDEATWLKLQPADEGKGVQQGFEATWDNGNKEFRVHDANPVAPSGTNARSGWNFRYREGNHFMDADGNFWHKDWANPGGNIGLGEIEPSSGLSKDAIINATHIPIFVDDTEQAIIDALSSVFPQKHWSPRMQ